MISSLTKKFLSFVFTLVLVCPFLVFAQSNNDDERNFVEDQINKINQVSSAINQETMTIDLSPSTPKTGDTVTASLTTPGIDLDQAKITWYINGKKQGSDYGLKTFIFTVDSSSSSLEIKATAIAPNDKTGTGSLIIRPSEVVLVWEAVSYTPPFYKGKALASRGSNIRIIALPEIVNIGNKKISSKNLVYKWFKNDTLSSQYSGFGKDSFYAEDSSFVRDGNEIKAQVYTTDSSAYSESKIFVSHSDPKVFFYQEHPLLGRLYNQPVINFKISGQDESKIIAEPYFFSANKLSTRLDYSWTINGKPIDVFGPAIKVGNPNNSSAQSIIALSIKHLDKLLQGASGSFTIGRGSGTNSNPSQTNF